MVNSSSNSSSHISTEECEELEIRHEILKSCLDYGIYFDPSKPTTEELFKSEIEDVSSALEYFVKRGGNRTDAYGKPIIEHPQGWLISCLRYGYWLEDSVSLSDALVALNSFLPTNLPRDYQ